MNSNMPEYKYKGAQSMIQLHEKYLRSFVETWKKAKVKNVMLPKTDDSDYASMQSLLRHILRAARGYMTWMCEQLNLPDPQINPTPGPEDIESKADDYLEHLIEKWKLPLAKVEKAEYMNTTYKSRWGVEYCIDAMLEHAVMHPIRHEFQLKNFLNKEN